MSDFRKRVRFYYNTFAGYYDLSEFFRRGTREAVFQASGCQVGDRALEICSGTCELALAFARRGVSTAAVDLAREMLLIGRSKANDCCLDLLESDALCLPFASNSFDVVVISLALHHMPEAIQIGVLKEMSRLAKKQVISLEWHTPSNSIAQTIKGLLIRIMDVSEYIQPWMHQDFHSTCRQAGLNVVSEKVLTAGFHRLTTCFPIDKLRNHHLLPDRPLLWI